MEANKLLGGYTENHHSISSVSNDDSLSNSNNLSASVSGLNKTLEMTTPVSLRENKLPLSPTRGNGSFSRFPNSSDQAIGLTFVNGKVVEKELPTPNPLHGRTDVYLNHKYRLRGVIGKGEFGSVIRVLCQEEGKEYAVKKSRKKFESKTGRRNQLKEVKNHERIEPHPNVVTFYQAWEEKKILYLRLELCRFDLKQMEDFMTSLKDSSALWCAFIDSACGLQHLHSSGCLHMDVKPANIFLGYDWHFKVGDLGCSLVDADDVTAVTGEGTYTPFEVGDKKYTVKADVFSLGTTFKEMNVTELEGSQIKDHDLDQFVVKMILEDHNKRPDFPSILNDPIIQSKNEEFKARDFRNLLKNTVLEVLEKPEDDLEEHINAFMKREYANRLLADSSNTNINTEVDAIADVEAIASSTPMMRTTPQSKRLCLNQRRLDFDPPLKKKSLFQYFASDDSDLE